MGVGGVAGDSVSVGITVVERRHSPLRESLHTVLSAVHQVHKSQTPTTAVV